MAKSITALAVGIALREGLIKSLDDSAERYAPGIRGTVLGQTSLRNLLRMASGMKHNQTFDGSGDTGPFSKAISKGGIEAAIHTVTVREVEQGTRFYYASPHTVTLAAVVRGATGMSLSEYLTPRLWQAIGAADSATWYADRTGLEVAFGSFNATLRDYARLGVVLANDGLRPDDPGGRRSFHGISFSMQLTGSGCRRRFGRAGPHPTSATVINSGHFLVNTDDLQWSAPMVNQFTSIRG